MDGLEIDTVAIITRLLQLLHDYVLQHLYLPLIILCLL
ncbi:MAG: hypothetical protein PG977_000600 [Bartonella clarridgeiae]|nr:MAG: hypothetical protein PG977_000600 [Bartonella clarridgeiae]